jgi:hypothetical protein
VNFVECSLLGVDVKSWSVYLFTLVLLLAAYFSGCIAQLCLSFGQYRDASPDCHTVELNHLVGPRIDERLYLPVPGAVHWRWCFRSKLASLPHVPISLLLRPQFDWAKRLIDNLSVHLVAVTRSGDLA